MRQKSLQDDGRAGPSMPLYSRVKIRNDEKDEVVMMAEGEGGNR